ncbi:MAG: ABC transporter permease subunit [Egibacteraceae bacterium]
MYASIFTKSVRDKGVAMLVGGVAIGLLLWMGMAAYSEIDMSFYYELPPAFLETMGIATEVGGVGGIAYGAMYNLMGAMTIAGLAISYGASTIAGEERNGTIGLLLGNPKSRTHVLGSKIAALVVLVAFGGLLLWGAALAVPVITGVDITGVAVGALVVHLSANALFWGMLAVAVGAWTGNRTTASGVAASLMVLSWLAVSILPFIERVADLAKLFPWYYFNARQPEANGINWSHLAVLLGLSFVLGVVAFIGVNRRDLRDASSRVTLLDRLRANPRTRAIADRVAGSARVSGITAKTLSDHQGMVVVVAALLCYAGLLIPPMYNLLPDAFTTAMANLPDVLISMIGGVDMSTPTGWLQGETFSLVVPVAFITVLAAVGSRALAGEEADHTMGLLLASPISRTKILLDKVVAMVAYGAMLGVITFVTNTAGVTLGGLNVNLGNLLTISVLATLLGLVFGGVALALSAATGRVMLAVYGAAGLGLVSYFIDAFFPLAASFESWAVISPFHYYLSSDPLVNGMAWGHAAVLAALFAVLVAVSIPLFNRRPARLVVCGERAGNRSASAVERRGLRQDREAVSAEVVVERERLVQLPSPHDFEAHPIDE